MTEDAIFPIHSVTKTITSVAAMMLVDRGKIALDDPVSKYIPSFAGMTVGVERKDEMRQDRCSIGCRCSRPITVEDLLLHTSGITYGFYGEGLVKAAYAGIYLGDFDNAGFAERISKVPLAEQPHTLWDYGHSSRHLGRVIEVASGQSLYQFEKENLLDPLGMTTTKFFLTDPAERARYAQPLAQGSPCRAQLARRHPLGIRRRRHGLDHRRLRPLRPDAAQWRDARRQDLSRPRDLQGHDHGPYRARRGRCPRHSITIPATALASATVSACESIPVSRFRRRPARSASSNGTARPDATSWSTRPRTCFSW